LTDKADFGLTLAERNALLNLIESPGGMLASKLSTTAYTSPPTASTIATAVRTDIERIGGTLAGVLTASAYTPPPSASDIAVAVENALLSEIDGRPVIAAFVAAVQQGFLNETDGQAVVAAIVGAIGNQNIDQVALVAAIRADLERIGGLLASRLSSTAYSPAPSATDVAGQVWGSSSRTLTGPVEVGTASVEAVGTYLERSGGLLKAVADFLAQLNPTKLANVATAEALLTAIAAALSSL
jgi:hypothetical protein